MRRQLRRALKAIRQARPPFGEEVHETRAALKRVRALLNVMQQAGKTRKRLRKVGRRIGRLRDANVVIATFDRVVAGSSIRLTPALKEVRVRLETQRAALESDPRTARDLEEAQKTLRRAMRRLEPGRLARPAWPTIVGGLVDGYRAARRAMDVAYRRNTDRAFHRWRKAVKAHAYQLRLLDATAGEQRARQHVLQRLGEALGDAQDLAAFEATLRAEQSCFRDPEDGHTLLAEMLRRRRQLRGDVRPLGAQLFSERPRDFARRLRG